MTPGSRGGAPAGPPSGVRLPPPGRLRPYGLTQEDWLRLGAGQGWACAICRKPFGWSRPVCVDHDHLSGETMGLLCPRCNRDLLGLFRRDPAFYTRAAEYLTRPPTMTHLGAPRWHVDSPIATRQAERGSRGGSPDRGGQGPQPN